jgi:putative transposase
MQTMGIEAIYPTPRLSQTQPMHRVYPYLLRGVPILRVNQVWRTDITYIRLHGGFISLVGPNIEKLLYAATYGSRQP